MKILFVSPEVSPIVRTGGLGDVVGSLPIAINGLGADARILCPMHRVCTEIKSKKYLKAISVKIEDLHLEGKIWKTSLPGNKVTVYLLDLPEFYDRPGVYADQNSDFPDNPQRAFALCQAALQIHQVTDWNPDIIHAHDWMAAPVCAYLNAAKLKNPSAKIPKSVLTIHNLQHQGIFDYKDFLSAGFPSSYWGMDGFEKDGSMNLLKGGIQHADKITTVSPTYAEEIRTPLYGCGLEASLEYRGADLIGILNGIDTDGWNPKNDTALPHKINPARPKSGKLSCKNALLKELNMQASLESPLFGVVSRLYEQKGLDLLLEILPQLMAETHANFAILGSGDSGQEEAIRELSLSYPDRIGSMIGFDDGLARRIFGGSDFFIMPSRFEPCGLAQQYAMRYGSLPIGRKTGGLADTIRPISRSEPSPNGFLFSEATGIELWNSIKAALSVFANKRKFSQLRKNAFFQDCGWGHAAEQYLQTYKWALDAR